MARALIILLALAALSSAGQGEQAFTGVITDSVCSTGDHSQMRMGPTDAECVSACIADHDASYVLADGTHAYQLSDQKMPGRFAGTRVKVTGTLDAKTTTIRVASIVAAQ